MALATVSDDGHIRELRRIDIPHANPSPVLSLKRDLKQDISQVIQYVDKGKPVPEIAEELRMDPDLAKQICRLYLTHPGVSAEGNYFEALSRNSSVVFSYRNGRKISCKD